VESTDTTDEVVAYVQHRCVDPELSLIDMVSFSNLLSDATNGRLRIQVRLSSFPEEYERYPMGNSIVMLEGFPTSFEILETFAPDREQVSFRVPVMPEGSHAADHFDTYWGYVSRPLLSQTAQPLQCNYPDHPPAIGEYLTFPDLAPTPAPGHAVYYLTSVTFQGQTRAGRRALDGRLSGRDASQLPACVDERAKR
jgi:hypothetical protein